MSPTQDPPISEEAANAAASSTFDRLDRPLAPVLDDLVAPVLGADSPPPGHAWRHLAAGWWERDENVPHPVRRIAAVHHGVARRELVAPGGPPCPLAPGLSWRNADLLLMVRRSWRVAGRPQLVGPGEASLLRAIAGAAPAGSALLPTAGARRLIEELEAAGARALLELAVLPGTSPHTSRVLVAQRAPLAEQIDAFTAWLADLADTPVVPHDSQRSAIETLGEALEEARGIAPVEILLERETYRRVAPLALGCPGEVVLAAARW